MKLNKVLVVLSFATFVLFAEPSVYTDSDFIDTDTIVKKNSRQILLLKQKIAQLKEKIDGLESIIKGQSIQIEQLKQKTNNNLVDIVNKLSQRVAALENRPPKVVTKIVQNNSENNANSSDSIEGTIEPNKKPKIKDALEDDTPKTKLSNKELYKQAVIDFVNKRYTKAKKAFKKLISKGYKKDASTFYLGEIAFYRKKYADAIIQYKKCAELNKNLTKEPAYMPKLFLHTAIALKKVGEPQKAKAFFEAVINSYPNSPSAKEAKKYLK